MRAPAARAKLLSLREAARAVRAAQRRGQRVVFTNGCFDLLHVGHVRCLEQARAHGDRLVVALNRDPGVREAKGAGRPIVPERQRAEVVAALGCVDWVVLFAEPTPLAAILSLRPDVLAKGGDWPRSAIIGRAEVEGWGGRVVRLRQVPGAHTTVLLARICANRRRPARRRRR